MGAPELPGIRRRIYYISKNEIAMWPRYNRDANRRTKTSVLIGSFTLVADAKWKYIDILAEKSQLTSDPQGEIPSQTQLNKLTAIHPGVGPEATAAACYLNNSDNVFIVEDMKGLFRVVGSEKWITKTTVTQDNGQGPTGTTSTTINVEATDEVPAPFYMGVIATDDGDIDCSESYEDALPEDYHGGSGGNGGSTNTGGNAGSVLPTFNSNVMINGTSYNVSGGSVSVFGPLQTLGFTGSNMDSIFVRFGHNDEEATLTSGKTSASWNGNIASGTVSVIHWDGNHEDPTEIHWFDINIMAPTSGSDTGSNTGSNTGGDTGSNTGSNTGGGSSTGGGNNVDPVYDNTVIINGETYTVLNNSCLDIYGPLRSIKVSGTNLIQPKIEYGDEGDAYYLTVSADKTSAEWTGNLPIGENVVVSRRNKEGASLDSWFYLRTIPLPSGGGQN